jgi:two-component system, chemotaxis family, CheB/CheR fusion protein
MTQRKRPIAKPAVQAPPAASAQAPHSSGEGGPAAEPAPDAREPAGPERETRFPIVGIGASAGGLAAFEAFFSGMPADTDPGMAFVLVQHLAPDHKSILSDLVKRYTRMQVFEVEDGMAVQPNCAYIIPPNHDMAFLNGTLQLLEPTAPRGMRLPIDFFFRSLAQDQRERAICIVLSGTGSDGALGVRAVKGEGGMVMVQTPDSTEFDGMPRSALATGLVDYALPPAEMPAQLIAYAAHAFGKAPRSAAVPTPRAEDALKKICVLLRDQTGHDFSQYKETTLVRRVERRMAVHQIELPNDYLRYLRNTPAEGQALFRDLLIGVTSFFRDPEAFAVLEAQVVPQLFAGKPAGAPVRVWVCGCSTGEEAYSLAILLQEHLDTLRQPFAVQIFATDIDRRAIEHARSGLYPASIAADLSPERLARFFTLEPASGIYRLQKGIRDLLIFSEQDVIKDPPFSRLDLICCRNLLIYLSGDLQKKLLPLFHYALNPQGLLFLGTSETVGDLGALFAPLDRKWKLYRRQDDLAGALRPALGTFTPPLWGKAGRGLAARVQGDPGRANLQELTEHTLLAHYAQAAVLVTGRGEILHITGRTGKYLEPATGAAGMNILAMAREGLRPALTAALRTVVARKEPVQHPGLRVRTNGDVVSVTLSLRPATSAAGAPQPDLFLVILEEPSAPGAAPDATALAPDAPGADAPVTEDRKRIAALEQELRAKEDYLQTALEEMETSTEELKSTNEEMQSVNEELQSTNEELETAKEELQSVNEELATVNAELHAKVADLSRANDDMNNLLAGTGVATLFVDHHLRIVRFTPTATELINLIPTDLGRPVAHLVSNLAGYDRLVADVEAVLRDLAPREAEVQTRAGAWFLMRIRPYRTLDNVIEGAVLTFTDITERRQAAKILEARERETRAILQGLPNAVALLESVSDTDGNCVNCRFVITNDAYERLAGVTSAQVRGKTLQEVWPGADARWIAACGQVARSGVPSHFELSHVPTGTRYCCTVFRPGERPERVCAVFEDLAGRPPRGPADRPADAKPAGPEGAVE